MQLAEALNPRKGDIVAFVGAGGKTSAMGRLAAELADSGWRVVVTTTTRIRASEGEQYGDLIVEPDARSLMRRIRAALDSGCVPLAVAAGRAETGSKLLGIPSAAIQEMGRLADVVLVEADGARGRSIKAPAPHEPVIPPAATVVVPVVGLDALGQPIGSPAVHRPELLAALLGVGQAHAITEEDVVRLFLQQAGGRKGVPPGARFIPFLNKAEDSGRLASGRRISWRLKREPAVDGVLVGAVRAEAPFMERWEPAGVVVLAAGQGERYGEVKQLLPLRGRPLLHHVMEAVLAAAAVDRMVVVLGAHATRIAETLAAYMREPRVAVARNEDWRSGLSSSLHLGLRELGDRIGAALMVLGDQPGISSALVGELLIRRARTGAPLVAPVWQGRRGNPVLFGRSLFEELEQVSRDEGGRSVVQRHLDRIELVEVPDQAALLDVDTSEDYVRLLRAWETGMEK